LVRHSTIHEVSVPAGFAPSLGCGHVAPEELVRVSFEFLLEHEPTTSITHEFSLDVISRYFPGYPAEVSARLGRSDPGTPRVDDPRATSRGSCAVHSAALASGKRRSRTGTNGREVISAETAPRWITLGSTRRCHRPS
jgi:hypothetical protein